MVGNSKRWINRRKIWSWKSGQAFKMDRLNWRRQLSKRDDESLNQPIQIIMRVNIYWSICSPYMHLAHLIPITTLFFYRWATCCLESLSKDRKVPKLAASILVQAVWPRGWAVNQSAQVFKVDMFLRRMSWKKISGPGGRRPELCSLLCSLLWEFEQIAFLPSMGLETRELD